MYRNILSCHNTYYDVCDGCDVFRGILGGWCDIGDTYHCSKASFLYI